MLPKIQKGVHTTHFVHNMLLQIDLDARLPAMLKEVSNKTDTLAYQLRNKLAIELSEAAWTYLEPLKTRLQ